MKHYHDFARSGHTFRERIGEPTESDAALGRITLSFSLLEDIARGLIQVFMSGESDVAVILTAESSFRQLVDVLGSLARHRIDRLVPPSEREHACAVTDEVLQLFT